jgi:hypothetical protein
MAGELKHPDQTSVADDPVWDAVDAVLPSHWNKAHKLSGGSDKQLVERSTAADGTTGMNLTSTPSANVVIFPLTVPTSPPNGSFWVEDDGVTVKIWVKRADGSLVSADIG